MSYVIVKFNTPIRFNDSVYDLSNYVFTPALTVDSVEKYSNTELKVGVSGFTWLTTYRLKVYDLANDDNSPVVPDAGTVAEFVVPDFRPGVLSAVAVDGTTVRVVYDADMNIVSTTTPANYSFFGSSTVSVSSVNFVSLDTVDVILSSDMLDGGTYAVTVSNVTRSDGVPLGLQNSAAFTGIGVAPQVVSAAQFDVTHIDITFDEAMETTSVETPGNYAITGVDTPVVSAASQTAPTTVRLTIPFALGGNYTVTVSSVTDVAGNTINAAHNDANFVMALNPFNDHATLGNNIITYWKFDTNANDSTPNAANGTLSSSGTSSVAGKISNCYEFDASAGTILLPTANNTLLNTMTSGTVSVWCKTHNKTKNPGQWVLGRTYYNGATGEFNWGINIDTFGNIDFYWSVAIPPGTFNYRRFLAAAGVSNDVWYHLVATWERSGPNITLSLYADGIYKTGYVGGVVINTSTVPLRFGARSSSNSPYSVDSADEFLDGLTDEIGLWTRALTAPEVTDLYNGGSGLTY